MQSGLTVACPACSIAHILGQGERQTEIICDCARSSEANLISASERSGRSRHTVEAKIPLGGTAAQAPSAAVSFVTSGANGLADSDHLEPAAMPRPFGLYWPGFALCAVIMLIALFVSSISAYAQSERSVEIPIGKSGEVDVADVVARLYEATGVPLDHPVAHMTLSTVGLARSLTKTMLGEILGPDVKITFRPGVMVITINDRNFAAARRNEWVERLRGLSTFASEAARRQEAYGMHALKSFRPNDRQRPTICLVHGLNSSSGGFVHMIPWLEEAGYGILVYDYPFNRRIEESCAAFARDWAAFRRETADKLPWAIVAHSMGALLARSLVEDDASWARDVSSLVLIAPVNQGSHLAKIQTLLQLTNGLKAVNGKDTTRAMLGLSDGLGQAAQDMLPGSKFLKSLNSRPRRREVAYHILAGDRGFLTRENHDQIQAQIELVTRSGGFLGRLAELATGDLPALLDELSDGTGDGCVTVEHTRLDGVSDHVTLHANHAELIRAPLLFADPGPVACMPELLRALKEERQKPAGRPAR
jgi:pimeloyl-ACP methyl ester carboxylesterase